MLHGVSYVSFEFYQFENRYKETQQHKPEGLGYTNRAHLRLSIDDQPLFAQRQASTFEMYKRRFFEYVVRLSNATTFGSKTFVIL